MTTIGLISDTHNHWDPYIAELFQGVDHILHAGDIGLPWVIMELEAIAPVTAVLGNTDSGLVCKETEVLELGGRKFLVHHQVNPCLPHEALKRRLLHEQPAVVVFGHTHQPFSQVIGQILYVNPGYAGKMSFNRPRSVALLRCDAHGIETEFKSL